MSTLLVLHFLLDLLNKSRTDAKALTMRNYFKDVGMLVTQEASRHNDVLKFSVGDFLMHVLPTGKLQGFRLWLGRHVHKQVVQLWLTLWKWMAREDNGPLLTEDISSNDDEEPSLVDLLMFCVNFIHSYKAAHSFRQPPPFSTDSMRNLQQCVLKFVAWVVNNVVLEMMTQQDDSQPVPSRRVRRLGGSQNALLFVYCKIVLCLCEFSKVWKLKVLNLAKQELRCKSAEDESS